MDHFDYRGGSLFAEQMPVASLAEEVGTPFYLYSRQTLLDHYDRIAAAFAVLDPMICYSVKCSQNLHLLRILSQRGSGFDVVSGGELYRALRAGADPKKIVFAGVGKTGGELHEAFVAGIGLLNVESESELLQLRRFAQQTHAPLRAALRVNPDVDPKTHRYTTTGKKETKFGVDIERAMEAFRSVDPGEKLKLCGVHLHIGSPVNDVEPYRRSIEKALDLIGQLRREGREIDTLDIGGGFGAHYAGGEAPPASAYAETIVPLLRGAGLKIILEPGRSIAGNAGILVARVLHVKKSGNRRFVIVDASMNELIRPALYGAYHFVWPVVAGDRAPQGRSDAQPHEGLVPTDVVGPVCESGDFLAKDRMLPPVERGDLLAMFTAGAYAMTMASQYNSRPRAPEVLVEGDKARVIRRRETYDDLVACEVE